MSGKESPEKKKKSGSQNRQRKRGVYVACTEEERAAIGEKAKAAGLSAGGYLRACGLSRVTARTKKCAPVDREVLEHAIAALRRVGNNINQLAKAANMNQPTDSALLQRSLKAYVFVLQELREARAQ